VTPLERVRAAYDDFLKSDQHLLTVDANERSLTNKLACYLEHEFPGWDVDCEYNRDGHETKRLDGPVVPDVIIHRRGIKENFIVIEAKKSSTSGVGNDVEKLLRFKSELGYLVAIAVNFPVRTSASGASSLLDVVEVSL
jgi:hypothetical protein